MTAGVRGEGYTSPDNNKKNIGGQGTLPPTTIKKYRGAGHIAPDNYVFMDYWGWRQSCRGRKDPIF